MKAAEIKILQNAASLLMVTGASGAGQLDEAALALSSSLTQYMAQRIKADAQQTTIRAAARKTTGDTGTPPPQILRKTA